MLRSAEQSESVNARTETLDGQTVGARLPIEGLAPGATVDRFVIRERIGAGGMGVVYLAHDPDLDRTVALKLIKVASEDRNQRLAREARALARVSHPNVVTVYECGIADDQLFVVMEYVPGQTLRGFMASKPEPSRILEVFSQAARGLAAVHKAGLVHRDFKPDNVLVDDDGGVKVVDFGIARLAGDSESAPVPLAGAPETRSLSPAGTPHYMSPEQHRGEAADARSDQFSFCVSLFEALTGRMPFAGASIAEIAETTCRGEPVFPDDFPAPRAVRELIARGLATEPAQRFASMAALAEGLQPDRKSRWRWVLGALAVVAVLAVPVAYALRSEPQATCEADDQRLAGVWNASSTSALESRFRATGKPHAAGVFAQVARQMETRLALWRNAYRQVCEATHRRGEQSEALLDHRMLCLDRQLIEMKAVATALGSAFDPQRLDRAVTLVDTLSESTLCTSSTPETAVQLSEPDELWQRYYEARALRVAGKLDDAAPLAEALLAEAGRARAHAAAARAGTLLGDIKGLQADLEGAEKLLRAAANDAATAKDDRLTAEIWTKLMLLLGVHGTRYDEARTLATVAEAAASRVDADTTALLVVRLTQGNVEAAAGNYEGARDRFAEAIAIAESSAETAEALVGDAHFQMGNVLSILGDGEQARDHLEKALAHQRAAFGDMHPSPVQTEQILGVTLRDQGRSAEALKTLEVVADKLLALWGEQSQFYAVALEDLAGLHTMLRDFDQATRLYVRAQAILENVYGKDHWMMAGNLANQGGILLEIGRAEQALPLLERALALSESAHGSDHPELSVKLLLLGRAAASLGDRPRALELCRRGLAIEKKILGEGNPSLEPYEQCVQEAQRVAR